MVSVLKDTTTCKITQESYDNENVFQIQLGPGSHRLSVRIKDKWNGATRFDIPGDFVVERATAEDVGKFLSGNSMEELLGTGDKEALLLALQAYFWASQFTMKLRSLISGFLAWAAFRSLTEQLDSKGLCFL